MLTLRRSPLPGLQSVSWLLSVVMLSFAASAEAAPGDLDPAFGTGGVFTAPFTTQNVGEAHNQAIAVDSQRRVVIASSKRTGPDEALEVLRLTPAGALDSTFNPQGTTPGIVDIDFSGVLPSVRNAFAEGIAIGPGDTVVALARLDDGGATYTGLVRLDAGGAYDAGFGTSGRLLQDRLGGPLTAASPESLAVDGTGRILVGGQSGVDLVTWVERLLPGGQPDTSFNHDDPFHPGAVTFPDPSNQRTNGFLASEVKGLAILPSGRILAAGGPDRDSADAFAARLEGAGTLDPTFNPNGAVPGIARTDLGGGPGHLSTVVNAVATDAANNVYLAGQASSPNRMKLLRLTPSGTPDPAFGANGLVSVLDGARADDVTIDRSGCAILAGHTQTSSPQALVAARVTAAGALDHSFSGSGVKTLTLPDHGTFGDDVALQGDRILVGGYRQPNDPNSGISNAPIAVGLQAGGACGGGPQAAAITVTMSPASIVADGASHATATATVTDAQGAPRPGEQIAFSSDDEGQAIGAVTDHGDGTYTATVTSSTTAHETTITATDASATPPLAGHARLTQTAGPATAVSLSVSPATITADGASQATAGAIVTDANGNRVSGDDVSITSTDAGQQIGPVTDQGNGAYVATIKSSQTPGAATITATDRSVTPALTAHATLTQAAPGQSTGGGGGVAGSPPPIVRVAIGDEAAMPHALSFNAATTQVGPGLVVKEYIWDTDGNGSFDWQCGTSPVMAEGFGRAGEHTIGVRVVDSIGQSTDARIRVDVPAIATNGVRPTENPVDCENPGAGNQADRADCIKSFGFSIIDVNSRGRDDDCFELIPRRATTARAAQRPVTAPIHYYYRAKIRGPIAMNGLYMPVPRTTTSEFDTGDETIDIGRLDVSLGPFSSQPIDLRLQKVTVKNGAYHLDDVLLSGANGLLGGLRIKGKVTIDLINRASRTTIGVALPQPFSLDPRTDHGAQGSVTLRSDNVHGVSFDGIQIKKFDAYLGFMTIRNATFTYRKSDDSWSGGADIYLPGSESGLSPLGVNAAPPPPDLGFGIKGGQFDHAGLGLNFQGPTRPLLFPEIYLRNIHAALGLRPLRFTGGLGLDVGEVVKVDGDVFVAFATPSQPYDYPTDQDAGTLAPLAGRHLDSFTVAIGGTASLHIPFVNTDVGLAHATAVYSYPDYFEIGAGYELDMVLVKITGDMGGFILPSQGKFSFDSRVEACPDIHLDLPIVGDVHISKPCFGAGVAISTTGIGLCGTIPIPFFTGAIPVEITVGYRWGEGVGLALFTCDLGPYKEANPRASSAAAGWSLELPAKLPSAMVRVTGNGKAPDVVLSGPGGRTISTADPPKDTNVVVIRDGNQTLIALKQPAGGRWQVAAADGSAPVTAVASANGLPAPTVSARVSGSGQTRTLRYTVQPEPGRTVSFAERGPRTFRILGKAHGARGHLRFTPGDGRAGRRDIVALVSENGINRPSQVVAHYSAPATRAPGRPRHVRVRRRGSTLKIDWRRSAGATDYAVVVSTSDGHRVLRATKRRHVTITDVPPASHGTVQVSAERPDVAGRATTKVGLRAVRAKRRRPSIR